ncbi:hypothetical protein [Cryobacterium tagatosivorans]|uniref:Uncharacterized protein n=1 Tax=Cryobacterium tagatosivorans TaxID=1259199 RepID=A0A4R8UHR6_9MICO|nr:hypothetical protein [Cryobacterium tagatosivorans]TFB56383.1 hypothetical protein E3O23_01225 [Cryobacterium tagatosivorans]
MTNISTGDGSRSGADRAAHERSVGLSVAEIAAVLQAQLGQALLGVIVGKNARTLARWAHATVRPPHASEKLLRDTFQVFEILSSIDSPEVARAWLMGMNPELDDASPAEALADGRSREVMAAARSYIAAG